jgi:transcriptional regulator with XRE-family HTH domain
MVRAEELRKRVGERVRHRRIECEFTQEELAERLDLDESTIRAIEAGRRGVSLTVLVALAQALNVEPGSLIDEKATVSTSEAEAAQLVRALEPAWQRSAVRILREIHKRCAERARG